LRFFYGNKGRTKTEAGYVYEADYEKNAGGDFLMTTKEAKELTLIKWRFRRDYPTRDLPGNIMERIFTFPSYCPLCSLFGEADCSGCPLLINRLRCGAGVFKNWCEAFERKDWDAASYFADKIVKTVEKWEVK
jgi:hypothetical protein